MNVLNNYISTICHFLGNDLVSKYHEIFEIVLRVHFSEIFANFNVNFYMQVDNSNLEQRNHQDEWFMVNFTRDMQHCVIHTQPSNFVVHLHHYLVTEMRNACLIDYEVYYFHVVTFLHFCKWRTDFDCFVNE